MQSEGRGRNHVLKKRLFMDAPSFRRGPSVLIDIKEVTYVSLRLQSIKPPISGFCSIFSEAKPLCDNLSQPTSKEGRKGQVRV